MYLTSFTQNDETNLITSISNDEFDIDNLTVTSWRLQAGSASCKIDSTNREIVIVEQ